MTNFEKYKKDILDITEDSNLYASLYDLKCLSGFKNVKDDEFLYKFFVWISKENENN